MKNLGFKYRLNTSPSAVHSPRLRFASYFVFLPALGLFAACASSKIPTLYDTNPALMNKQYPVEEIGKIEQDFSENPKQYAQEMGDLILWRMYKKNSEFARKFGQTPELRGGLDEKKTKALVSIYNLMKDQDIPANLFEDEGPNAPVHQIILEWGGETKSNWSGTIHLRKSGNLTERILDVKPLEFDQGEDEIDQESWRKTGRVSWKSVAGREDVDGIALTLAFPLHRKIAVNVN